MYKRWVIPTLVFITISLGFSLSACDQLLPVQNTDSVTEDWVSRYDGGVADDDGGQAIEIDSQGNIYVAGYSWGGNSSSDYVTMKYDSTGNQLWAQRYNGPGNGDDWALDMTVDMSDNLYVTGWSRGNGTEEDCATIKYDIDGNQLWVARYDGPVSGFDLAYAIEIDYSGDVYTTGWSQGNGTGADFITIKYGSNGEQIWSARYNGTVNGEDKGYSVAVDTWGNVYVAGWSQGNASDADYTTIKYDNGGNQLWVARYDGTASGEDQAQSITVDSWGNVFVTGWSVNTDSQADYTTIKYNNYGEQVWIAHYDGPAHGEDKAYDMIVDLSGSIVVAGSSVGNDTNTDYAVTKYDKDGNELWTKRYNGPASAEDVARSIGIDSYGNIYVSGWSRGDGVRYDFATIKYDPDGNQLWAIRYNGPASGHDKVYDLDVDGSGNTYVTGRSSGETTYYDYTTIKYSQR